MNINALSSLRASLGAWMAPWRARWKALAPRDRRLVGVALLIAGLALLWLLAIAPAWRVVREAPARLDQLDAQLLTMQRLAAEARTLRAAPPVSAAQSQAALKASTEALGGAARLVIAGDRATVTFVNANGTQVRDWLAEARGAARARPVEASLSRGPQGLSGSVVLMLPAGGAP
ncbi:MAG TPA: type II secretion system protein GspM [Burkholderiaceae bacterium]|nr:type II secretion system protein GspM [Burkholderiaceae bacterium]